MSLLQHSRPSKSVALVAAFLWARTGDCVARYSW